MKICVALKKLVPQGTAMKNLGEYFPEDSKDQSDPYIAEAIDVFYRDNPDQIPGSNSEDVFPTETAAIISDILDKCPRRIPFNHLGILVNKTKVNERSSWRDDQPHTGYTKKAWTETYFVPSLCKVLHFDMRHEVIGNPGFLGITDTTKCERVRKYGEAKPEPKTRRLAWL